MQKLCRDEILLKNLFVKDLEDRIVVKKNIPFNYHFLFPPRRGIRLELLEVIIMDIHAPMIYTRYCQISSSTAHNRFPINNSFK